MKDIDIFKLANAENLIIITNITKEDIRACIIYKARSLSLEEIKLVAWRLNANGRDLYFILCSIYAALIDQFKKYK